MKELHDAIEKSGIDLAKAKEGFIIEEIAPYFNDEKLIQKLKVRLIEVQDIKRWYIDKLEELAQWTIYQVDNIPPAMILQKMRESFGDAYGGKHED